MNDWSRRSIESFATIDTLGLATSTWSAFCIGTRLALRSAPGSRHQAQGPTLDTWGPTKDLDVDERPLYTHVVRRSFDPNASIETRIVTSRVMGQKDLIKPHHSLGIHGQRLESLSTSSPSRMSKYLSGRSNSGAYRSVSGQPVPR